MGLYLEDFTVGAEFRSPGRTITEHDVMAFAGLSGDFNPAHTDHEYARASDFGRPIAHGLLALIVSAGLADRDGSSDGTNLALLGLSWRFAKPVFFGDTLRVKLTVKSVRRTSRGDRGVLVRDVEVTNQHGEVVQAGEITTMMKARTPPAPPSPA